MQNDLIGLLENLTGRAVAQHGEELVAFCPFHENHNTPSFSMNAISGKFICFSAECGKRGDYSYFKKLAGIDTVEGFKPSLLREITDYIDTDVQVGYPLSLLEKYEGYHPYWEERGITKETAQIFQLGYDFATNRVTIPIFLPDGTLGGVQARAVDEQQPKYLFVAKMKKSEALFGLSFAMNSGTTCILVEGALSVILGYARGITNMVATLGCTPSEKQVKSLENFNRIYCFYDYDKAGTAGALKVAAMTKVPVYRPPQFDEIDDLWYNDIEDLKLKSERIN